MITEAPAYATIPVTDMKGAGDFYGGTLPQALVGLVKDGEPTPSGDGRRG
jgi:hypothetical protein